MNFIKPNSDELVQSITCYNPKHLLLHYYLSPFICLYSFLIYHWFDKYQGRHVNEINIELWFLYVGLSVFSQLLLFLSCQWSVSVNCLLAFRKSSNPETATYVKVVPVKNNGSTELRLLKKRRNIIDNRLDIWFYFQVI